MKKLTLYAGLLCCLIALAHPVFSQSRLGIIGEQGLVVKSIDPATSQPDLEIGDVITATTLTGQIFNIERFQQAVQKSSSTSVLPATSLRFNPATGSFKERSTNLKTYSIPSLTMSRLGVVGEPGFVVKSVDPATSQVDLEIGDIITATTLTGQIVDVTNFQQIIKESQPGVTIQATRLRFNPRTGNLEENQIQVKTFPYPAVSFSQSNRKGRCH
jgi:hypothetical protein